MSPDLKKRKFFGNRDPQTGLRRMLLNSLMQYPLPAEEVIRNAVEKMGLTREDVLAAARWWNVTEENRDGEVFWHKPDVLVLLPSCPQNFLPRPSSAGPRRRRVQPIVNVGG